MLLLKCWSCCIKVLINISNIVLDWIKQSFTVHFYLMGQQGSCMNSIHERVENQHATCAYPTDFILDCATGEADFNEIDTDMPLR